MSGNKKPMKKLNSDIGERKSAEANMDFGAQRDIQAQIRKLKGTVHWEGDLEEMRTSKRESVIGDQESGITIDDHNERPTTNNLQ